MVCHSRAAGFVLGLGNPQVNRARNFGGVVDNQLRAWNHIGLFKKKITVPKPETAHVSPYDKKANLDRRARRYLHINCSVCHVSDGGGNAKFEVGYGQTKNPAKLLAEKPLHGKFGLSAAAIVKAGDPFGSVLLYRLSKWGRGRMPHVGSQHSDEAGLNLIHDWIASLDQRPDRANLSAALAKAEYLRLTEELISASTDAQRLPTVVKRALGSPRGAFMLARAVARETQLRSVQLAVARQGRRHPNANVRDLFERFLPLDERTKRLGDLVNPAIIMREKGDAKRGRNIFFAGAATQCRNCHKIQNKGSDLGPDLSKIGKRYKRGEILESLLLPSKKIDPKFVTVVVLTGEGQVLTGIVVKRDKKELVLRSMEKGKATLRRLDVGDVEKIMPQKTSLMPEKLLRDMTAQQAADLVEFLFSLK